MKKMVCALLLWGTLVAEEAYVTAECGGQLGNQMFKLAGAMSYGWDHELKAVFPSLNKESDQIAYNRDRIFWQLDAGEIPVELVEYATEKLNYEPIPGNLKNVKLVSGFFSWKYFDHHRERLRGLFIPSNEVRKKVEDKYHDLIGKEGTVAIHVRTYSKPVHDKGLHFLGFDFFKRAMEEFPENSTFVVFSDRIGWTKANFLKRFPEKNFIFIEGNDHIEDFYLMSLMKNHVLSRSSFSWWAAYLSYRKDAKVIAPVYQKTWLQEWITYPVKEFLSGYGLIGVWHDEEYNHPSWTSLPYSLEPYPEDMNDYDESTSVWHEDKNKANGKLE